MNRSTEGTGGTGDTVRITTQELRDFQSQMNRPSPLDAQAPPPSEVRNPVQPAKQPISQPKAPTQKASLQTPHHRQPPSKEELLAWRSDDILRIVPENLDARYAVHGLLEKQRSGELSDHHSAYLKMTGQRPAKKRRDPVKRKEGESEDEDIPEEAEKLLKDGYFRIGFDCHRVLLGLQWSLGRGDKSAERKYDHRDVDILLAPPGSALAKRRALGSPHIVLGIDSSSAAWKIVAVEGISFQDKELQREQQHALYRPSTRFEVNGMVFCIEFAIRNREQELRYLACRDQVIMEGLHDTTTTIKTSHTSISGIPFESDILLDTIVFRHGLGAGTFAACYEGFDPVTGQSRVVKCLEVKDEEDRKNKLPEVKALKRLGRQPGIVKLYGIYNSLNGDPLSVDPVESQLPLHIWMVMEKGMDFRRVSWDHSLLRNWRNRVWLAKRLLMGLKEIHARGYMHRDITRQNVLLHYPTLDASLCDFGKVYKGNVAYEYSICAANLCPPEITQYQARPYNRSVDVYLLGQVFALTWFPEAFVTGDGQKMLLRTYRDYEWITKQLLHISQTNGLANLILHMVQWEPEDRTTAAQALHHRCFTGVEGPTDEGHMGQKRPAELNEPGEASKARAKH